MRTDIAPSRASSGAAARSSLPYTSSGTAAGFQSTQAIFSMGVLRGRISGARRPTESADAQRGEAARSSNGSRRELRRQRQPAAHELGAVAHGLRLVDLVLGQAPH